jgi:hypothetical protein
MDKRRATDMKEFETIVNLPHWAVVEGRFRTGPFAKLRKVFDRRIA